jgi:hypothetical protein
MTSRSVLMILCCAGAASSASAGDDCGSPTPISGNVIVSGDISSSLPTAGIPSNHCGGTSETNNDEWYLYTAGFTGSHFFTTCGSGYDTVLSLWSSCPDGTLTPVSCDDDSGCGNSSEIIRTLNAGQQILIRVSGYNNRVGSYTLQVVPPGPTPANDSCGNATTVLVGSSTQGSTINATNDGLSSCGAAQNGPDVWYSFTAPSNGFFQFDTCATLNHDSVLSVFDACGGAEIVCDNSSGCSISPLTAASIVQLESGQTVLLRVSGNNRRTGPFVLNVNEYNEPVPSNDTCDAPIEVFDGNNNFSTIGASSDNLESCDGASVYREVYYTYTASCTGEVSVSTCIAGFDTVVVAYDACGGSVLACNNNGCGTGSAIVFPATAGTTYTIVVGGVGSSVEGSGLLSVSCDAPPCSADFNQDGFLDFFDYDAYVGCFEGLLDSCPNADPLDADFNFDGFVDFFDYDDYVLAFETGC